PRGARAAPSTGHTALAAATLATRRGHRVRLVRRARALLAPTPRAARAGRPGARAGAGAGVLPRVAGLPRPRQCMSGADWEAYADSHWVAEQFESWLEQQPRWAGD